VGRRNGIEVEVGRAKKTGTVQTTTRRGWKRRAHLALLIKTLTIDQT